MLDTGMVNMVSKEKAIPLCWDDQVQQNGAKVLTPRGPPKEKRTIVSIIFFFFNLFINLFKALDWNVNLHCYSQ